ncbi:MAG: hypothetical protein JXD18_01840 [Anaerolineae bacterium]|nr:hypothetical protein [Anaerolineae bacterium]
MKTNQHFHLPATALMICAVALLILSGCATGDVTEEIEFNRGERWNARLTLFLNASERSLLESSGELAQQLDAAVAEAEATGASFDWRVREADDGSATYEIDVSGQGWDLLNEMVFDDEATIFEDEAGHIHFEWNPYWTLSSFRSFNLILRGGRIISSNADEQTGSSATWYGPTTTVTAEMTAGGMPTWLPTAAIGGGCICLTTLVLAAGTGILILRRNRTG